MLSEFFVQACEEVSLIAACGLFLITAVCALFQWNKSKALISHAGFAANSEYTNTSLANDQRYELPQQQANTSLNDDKRYGSSQPVDSDIRDEKFFLKLNVDPVLPSESKKENLLTTPEERAYPEMLTEAIGRRNYNAVGRMANRGLTAVQIANELGIPRGEVNLVLKLKALYGDGYNMALPLEAAYRAAS